MTRVGHIKDRENYQRPAVATANLATDIAMLEVVSGSPALFVQGEVLAIAT